MEQVHGTHSHSISSTGGDEADVCITVFGRSGSIEGIGFLHDRMINMACTRAKTSTILVGDITGLVAKDQTQAGRRHEVEVLDTALTIAGEQRTHFIVGTSLDVGRQQHADNSMI